MARYINTPKTSLKGINSELVKIEDAFKDVLDRQGEDPNYMDTDLDMNSHRILNLPAPVHSQEPVRLGDVKPFIDDTQTTRDSAIEAAEQAQESAAEAEVAAAKAEESAAKAKEVPEITRSLLIAQGLSGNYGFFEEGFTYNEVGDVGVDAEGAMWTYEGGGSLPVNVAEGTVPSEPEYTQVAFNDAYKVLFEGTNVGEVLNDLANENLYSNLAPNSKAFPSFGSLSVGAIIPSGVTHVVVDGAVYKQVPTRSGTVNEIIDGQILVGSVKCNLISEALLNKATPASVIGKRLRDGIATKIACYGDSTMWGATVGDLETQNPNNAPAMLNEALKSIYGGGIVTYFNRAKSGTTIRGMLSGGDGSGSTFAEKLQGGGLDNDADVIYCNHGTNDSTGNLSIEQYVLDLETFISLCRAQGITPILVTPNPKTYVLSLVDEPKLKRLQHYVNTMRSVAAAYGVDLVDQYALFTASNNQFKPNEIAPDGVHLSDGAYRQSGFNLAIPLVNCHRIGVDSKIAPLNNMSWLDNLSGREIQQQETSLGGFAIKSDKTSGTGFNLPVILEQGQDNLYVSGLRWVNGAEMNISYNKVSTGQKLNFEARAGLTTYLNYDSRARMEFRMYAGLAIVGLTYDVSSTGEQSAIGGLLISDNSGAGVTKITGTNTKDKRINYWDQIVIPFFNFVAGGAKLTLADLGGNDAIYIYVNVAQELKLDVIKDGSVASSSTLAPVFVDGSYPVNFNFDYDGWSVTVNSTFGSGDYKGIPEVYIKTPNVIYDVVEAFP